MANIKKHIFEDNRIQMDGTIYNNSLQLINSICNVGHLSYMESFIAKISQELLISNLFVHIALSR